MSELRFTIDVFKPDTIPMSRLAEYMSDLARLLGSADQVHFDRVEASSLAVIAHADEAAQQDVATRLANLNSHVPDPEVLKVFEDIDRKLRTDGAKATLTGLTDNVVEFPGRDRAEPVTYGPFTEDGVLQGQLIGNVGADKTKHLQLLDGPIKYTRILTTEEIARSVGPYMYQYVRLVGTGRWLRHEDGRWELKDFRVKHFEVLRDDSLVDVLARMRDVPGSGWSDLDDPIESALDLRRSDDEQVH